MADKFISLIGVDDLKKAISGLNRTMRRRVLLDSLRRAARVIQADAKQRAPVLRRPAPFKVRGLVRRSITVRSSRLARRKGMVGVFVTVRRSKAARERGSFSVLSTRRTVRPNDPYYFRFLEMGTKNMRPRSFLGPALQARSRAAVQAFEQGVRPEIEKQNRRK
jgi:HK97 gp10 family phage protein